MAQFATTKPTKLSYSALERFQFCPWVYYQADVCKQGIPQVSQSIRLGGILHHVIEQYHKAGPLLPLFEEAMVAYYHKVWPRYLPAFLFETEAEQRALMQEGEAILKNFYQDELSRKGLQRPVFSELAFEVALTPGYTLVGRIDRIDQTEAGAYRVIDYKSSRRPKETLLLPQQSQQLALYALGAQTVLGEAPEAWGFYYLAHREIVYAPYEKAQVEQVKLAFLNIVEALSSQQFTPDPSPEKCMECPYQPRCPAFCGAPKAG